MIRFITLSLVLAFLTLPIPCGAGEHHSRADQVRRQAEEAVALRAATQKLREEQEFRVSSLLDRVEELERELKDVSRHRKKTEAYLADQLAKVAELERRLAESKKIGRDLEPLLDLTLERLNRPARESPPDLAYKQSELNGLGLLLNNYDASLSRKTGRVFEVLKSQARLGSRVVVEETDLTIGRSTWRVKLIRLGRLALFALAAEGTAEGNRAWRYRPSDNTFQPLDQAAPWLEKMVEIAQGRRLAELIKALLSRPIADGEASR